MSRRFGRNQKRRMREAVATAESQAASMREAYDMQVGLLQHVSRRKDQLESVLNEARRRLGDMHIALPPTEVRVDSSFERATTIRVPDPMREPIFDWASDQLMPMELKVHDLERLIVLAMQHDSRSPNSALHCIVELAGKSAGYAISMNAVHQLRDHHLEDVLLPHVSKALTRELVSALKGKAGR